ncbi:MAG: isochorismatase [Chloroflexi bacterium]|nr:isochorismatase [Chloroflexota bacterium]
MRQLPLPTFFDPRNADQVWRVPYEKRASQALAWNEKHGLKSVAADRSRIWLLLVDTQNTFCLPDFELFVAGRSGRAAVDDTVRLCEFIYRNLGNISQITATLDTHMSIQIFHAIFLVDANGAHPAPYSQIDAADVRSGKWRFNPALAGPLDVSPEYGQEMLLHYVTQLESSGKYALTIWPYHAMLGGVGHALVSSVEEAIFFHSIARTAQTRFEVKGDHPFTENYSAIGPEVQTGPMGETLEQRNPKYVDTLQEMDALIVAGQAKSHCVAWTLADLLQDIRHMDASLARKIYLLEDCTSPVVVPGADFTHAADQAYAEFAEAGMHIVKSTDPIETWKDFPTP